MFENFDLRTLVYGGVVVLIIGFVLCFCGYVFILGPYLKKRRTERKAKQKKERAVKILAAEKQRIDNLPTIETWWMLKVPDWYALLIAGPVEDRIKGVWGSRYNHLVIYDRFGNMYMSMMIPEVLETLRSAEYYQAQLNVPLCGDGERTAGPLVTYEGATFEVYPAFLGTDTTRADWYRWDFIYSKFVSSYDKGTKYKSYNAAYNDIYPYDVRRELEAKAENLRALEQDAQ